MQKLLLSQFRSLFVLVVVLFANSVWSQTSSTEAAWKSASVEEHLREIARLRKQYADVLQTDLELQLRHAEYALKKAPNRLDVKRIYERIRYDRLDHSLEKSEPDKDSAYLQCRRALASKLPKSGQFSTATDIPYPRYDKQIHGYDFAIYSSSTNKFGSKVERVDLCRVVCSPEDFTCKVSSTRQLH